MILFNTFHGKKRGQGNLYRSAFLSKKIEKEEKTILLCSDLKSINHQIRSCFSKIYDQKKISFKKIINENDISLIVFDGPKITIKQSVFFSRKKIRTIQLNYDIKSKSNIKINHLYKKGAKNTYNYFLIRENIINQLNYLKYKKPIKALFSFGSSYQAKQLKITMSIIENLALKDYLIIVPNKKILLSSNKIKFKEKKYIINPNDVLLKKIYRSYNLGFTSGGLQLSEMIANRITTFCYPKNDNERKNLNYFKYQSLCYELKNLNSIINKIKQKKNFQKLRKKVEQNIIKKFKLNGFEKTKKILIKTLNEKYN